jgi:putative nucleotidyltransferase with HDIG domain
MSTSTNYASSLGGRVDQAKWEFGLPDGARRLIAAGDFDGRDNETLIAWLSADKLLSGRLLRWCNSPIYNLSTPYQSLTEAAQVMEACELTRLAVLAFARGLFPEGELIDDVQRDRLWGHSVAVGTVASMISRTCGRGDPSLVFVAGTLHDIGLCANQKLVPQSHRQIAMEVDELSATHEVERDMLGFDHTQLGAAIMEQWGLPQAVQAAALHHHAAACAIETEHIETILCVSIANYLCSRAGWSSTGFHNLPAPGSEELERMGINSGLLAVISQQVGGSLESASQLY